MEGSTCPIHNAASCEFLRDLPVRSSVGPTFGVCADTVVIANNPELKCLFLLIRRAIGCNQQFDKRAHRLVPHIPRKPTDESSRMLHRHPERRSYDPLTPP